MVLCPAAATLTESSFGVPTNTQGPLHLFVEGITTIFIFLLTRPNSILKASPDLVFFFPGKTDHRFVYHIIGDLPQ